jgi:hypothetical protein
MSSDIKTVGCWAKRGADTQQCTIQPASWPARFLISATQARTFKQQQAAKSGSATFDEGVYGAGIGAAGLICFDSTGTPVFKYSDLAQTGKVPFIDDCYALNVISEDEVWLCYYADFPLVCLRGFELQYPTKKLGPTRSLAITNGMAICSTAYAPGQLLRQSLTDADDDTALSPVDERGNIIVPPFSATARGSRLCLRTESSVYLSTL